MYRELRKTLLRGLLWPAGGDKRKKESTLAFSRPPQLTFTWTRPHRFGRSADNFSGAGPYVFYAPGRLLDLPPTAPQTAPATAIIVAPLFPPKTGWSLAQKTRKFRLDQQQEKELRDGRQKKRQGCQHEAETSPVRRLQRPVQRGPLRLGSTNVGGLVWCAVGATKKRNTEPCPNTLCCTLRSPTLAVSLWYSTSCIAANLWPQKKSWLAGVGGALARALDPLQATSGELEKNPRPLFPSSEMT